MLKTVTILYADGSIRGVWPVDSDVILPAAELEVGLHNRDFPDDQWTITLQDEEE